MTRLLVLTSLSAYVTHIGFVGFSHGWTTWYMADTPCSGLIDMHGGCLLPISEEDRVEVEKSTNGAGERGGFYW